MNKFRRMTLSTLLSIPISNFFGSSSANAVINPNQVIWPSDSAQGSVRLQSDELANLVRLSDIVINVKPGQHGLQGPIICTGKNIAIIGAAESTMVFMNPDNGGLRFIESHFSKVENVSFRWNGNGLPKRSHYGAALLFIRCNEAKAVDVKVFRSPGAGVHFDECQTPIANRCNVSWTGADGIHFANSNNCVAIDCVCENTGDDAIAVVDYMKKPASFGFNFSNIKVRNSFSRGIAIVGGSQGSISNCEVIGTSSNGLHIETDLHYETRTPSDISVSNVSISDSGYLEPRVGNQFAVNVLRAKNIRLDGIVIKRGFSLGVFVADSSDVSLRRINVSFTLGNSVRLIQSTIVLSDVSVSSSGAEFLFADNCSILNGSNLKITKNVVNLTGSAGDSIGSKFSAIRTTGTQTGLLQTSGIKSTDVNNKSPNLKFSFQ